jgi:hypothetical protein
MNDFLKNICEKYPDLKRNLKELKRSTPSDWRQYDNAMKSVNKLPLSIDENEECRKYISKILNI